MPITLDNYKTTLPASTLMLAEKNAVRECDETESGHFVAYVDEGNVSYDVSITVNKKKEVIDHGCDCPDSDKFCRHKVALTAFIAGKGKTKKIVVKAATKKSKTEQLLEEIEAPVLHEWLLSILKKNKDIELAFNNHFAKRHIDYTPEEVIKLMQDARKVVLGSKKKIDATQAKKLMDLWTDSLAPVVDHYLGNLMEESAFKNFHFLLEYLIQFHYDVQTNSTRAIKYFQSLLEKATLGISNLFDDEGWKLAVKYYVNNIPFEEELTFRIHYVSVLQGVHEKSNATRKKIILLSLAKIIKDTEKQNYDNPADYQRIMLDMIDADRDNAVCLSVLKPIREDNVYNIKLIKLLIAHGQTETAISHCNIIIKGNYISDYNVPYLKILKTVFNESKDKRLVDVLKSLLPLEYNYEDHLLLMGLLSANEQTKWQTLITGKAIAAGKTLNKNATTFLFDILNSQKKYTEMINQISDTTPYSVILKYCENMITADKARFMDKMIRKYEKQIWRFAPQEDNTLIFPDLASLFRKHYSTKTLSAMLEKTSRQLANHHNNPFMKYLQNHL